MGSPLGLRASRGAVHGRIFWKPFDRSTPGRHERRITDRTVEELRLASEVPLPTVHETFRAAAEVVVGPAADWR